ncbi:23S rRNA (pseudouridine(1915)-N(3))-methyltransferase RlmH [Puia dinghuensis]|uniref:Ribosomal RNA large subunit methyltransferase H n=1 Tax=Puia dinghuensis TaxID=1792502 RepID=A0A8J2UBG8_9BACT|nr:23S rRNA (pseudouridine(1915)-N(3))-methyltransferase RlmH [Puia dinghuensis]GGA94239.1 ribosomal RNA large subunit methyltransferase H [Puia dinghuensis]
MKILLWSVGKDNDAYVKQGIDDFTRRITRYFPTEWDLIPIPKNAATLSQPELKKKEAELILGQLTKDDYLVALDEHGKQMSSEGLAQFIQTRANSSSKNLVFLIGGVYGLDESVLNRASQRWSLSQLTLPHQLVRLVLAEQLYRACTILRNEKYHHP